MGRLLVLVAVIALIGVVAALWRARDGRIRRPSPAAAADARAMDVVAAVAPTTALVLVEFTASACQPCTRTRALLEQVSADRPEVSVAVVDVADAAELVRAHGILRAPTTLLVDARGRLLGRVAGVPRDEDLTDLIDVATSTIFVRP